MGPLRLANAPRDYVSENLEVPRLDRLFPDMIEADKALSTWPWFRKSVDHVWRVDRRNTIVGFISRDEAAVLYSNAKLFAGRKAIEVGALRGWSSVHLLASGVASLDIVEPLLAEPEWNAEFVATLKRSGGYRARISRPSRARMASKNSARRAPAGRSPSSTATTTATRRSGTR